ncbi:NAD(P)-dependent oxidoreductase [Kutzneria sp. 744]|uniref:NAD-dependent epimerase/dehydratase family protein n=1 Tax=Kutzneria sp. (strain 744) TaxID=345341 RepID=UPI0003EEDF40|nr:NAD(P)-dependent oxidoreductase [Kutzneria sp. 744]EWM11380.1 NAD-dependent epimerase/dehydratase [Kutzneria sp. 744]
MVFTLSAPLPGDAAVGRVLVTGAAGRIGSGFLRHVAGRYVLRATDVRPVDIEDFVLADLGDPAALARACEDVDTVVHLGANPSLLADWDSLLPANIVGTHNLFAAASEAGVRRVVFASSVHAVSGYPAGKQVSAADPVNPGNLYGVTKAFGEALGRYYAEQRGMSVIALRIGAFHTEGTTPEPEPYNDFLHLLETDLYRIIVRAIDVRGVQYAVVNAISDQLGGRLDITGTRELLG